MPQTQFSPSPRKGRLNQTSVVEAAVVLFNRQGYDRTSMNEIAAALGITKAALYHHFASKEDILIAGITQASEIVRTALRDSMKPGDTAYRQVEAFIHAYGKALLDPTFRCLVLADERVLGAEGQAEIRTCKRRNQHQLEALLQEAGADPAEIRPLALAVFGALNWSAVSFGERAGAELKSVTDAIVRLLCSALKPEQDRS
ncbi:MAG: TetR/AcrR family transcriptional regulator [Novosphingobium sp.]|nr:TetR/AcrR family transcriptional regulator [Novosphingobium sp.]